MTYKGREFKGITGGANYKRFASFFGIGTKFYQKALGDIDLGPGMKAVDLGCGPGALSFALAERAHESAVVIGTDISGDQLAYAGRHAGRFPCKLEFKKTSMDELPFPDGYFDLAMTSMALHETPPEVRRGAVREAARVLKPGGRFLVTDWSKPQSLFLAMLWFPMVFLGEKHRDNWDNTYPDLCQKSGLDLVQDGYINSFARRQVFVKNTPSGLLSGSES